MYGRRATASPYRCTPRCTPFSMSRVCRLRLSSRFKWASGVRWGKNQSRVLNHGGDDYGGRCSACLGGSGTLVGRTQKGVGARKPACVCAEGGRMALARPERCWDARRRDPRVNGADLYVVRVSKAGVGGASKPCWRCVRWCVWSGVKRIFHWDPVVGRFEVVKVNGAAGGDVYETSSDARLFAGAVCEFRFSFWAWFC